MKDPAQGPERRMGETAMAANGPGKAGQPEIPVEAGSIPPSPAILDCVFSFPGSALLKYLKAKRHQ